MAATIDSQVRAAGYVPIADSHEFRLMERNFMFEEEIEAGVPPDSKLAVMTVRCYYAI
jgi:hypothetical protein